MHLQPSVSLAAKVTVIHMKITVALTCSYLVLLNNLEMISERLELGSYVGSINAHGTIHPNTCLNIVMGIIVNVVLADRVWEVKFASIL